MNHTLNHGTNIHHQNLWNITNILLTQKMKVKHRWFQRGKKSSILSVLVRRFEMLQNNHTHGVEYGCKGNYNKTISEASQKSPPRMPAALILVALSSSDALYGTVPACEFDIPGHIEIPVCPWVEMWRLAGKRRLITRVTYRWFHMCPVIYNVDWIPIFFKKNKQIPILWY